MYLCPPLINIFLFFFILLTTNVWMVVVHVNNKKKNSGVKIIMLTQAMNVFSLTRNKYLTQLTQGRG